VLEKSSLDKEQKPQTSSHEVKEPAKLQHGVAHSKVIREAPVAQPGAVNPVLGFKLQSRVFSA
jgi:hypothetical protein